MAASTVVKIMVKVQFLPPKTEFSQREQFLEKGRGLKSECEHIKAKVQCEQFLVKIQILTLKNNIFNLM